VFRSEVTRDKIGPNSKRVKDPSNPCCVGGGKKDPYKEWVGANLKVGKEGTMDIGKEGPITASSGRCLEHLLGVMRARRNKDDSPGKKKGGVLDSKAG